MFILNYLFIYIVRLYIPKIKKLKVENSPEFPEIPVREFPLALVSGAARSGLPVAMLSR